MTGSGLKCFTHVIFHGPPVTPACLELLLYPPHRPLGATPQRADLGQPRSLLTYGSTSYLGNSCLSRLLCEMGIIKARLQHPWETSGLMLNFVPSLFRHPHKDTASCPSALSSERQVRVHPRQQGERTDSYSTPLSLSVSSSQAL